MSGSSGRHFPPFIKWSCDSKRRGSSAESPARLGQLRSWLTLTPFPGCAIRERRETEPMSLGNLLLLAADSVANSGEHNRRQIKVPARKPWIHWNSSVEESGSGSGLRPEPFDSAHGPERVGELNRTAARPGSLRERARSAGAPGNPGTGSRNILAWSGDA